MKKLVLTIFFLFSLVIGQKATAQCTAAFTKSVNQSTKTVTFTSTSSSNVTHYLWMWGDGTYSGWGSGTAFSTISHKYSQGGTYYATLVVMDSINRCNDSTGQTFSITQTCTSNSTLSAAGRNLSYYTYYPGALKLRWDFGDGTSSTSDTGHHLYAAYNTYNLCLTVYCSTTDSSKSCRTVPLTSSCMALFFIPGIDTLNKTKFKFYNQTTHTSTIKYLWKFGDGNTSTSVSPEHTYATHGSYNVCLFISDSAKNCKDSVCKTLKLTYKCDSNFHYYTRLDTLHYTYNANATNVKWKFGDGTTSTNKTGYHVYPSLGNYTLCLTAYCNSTDSARRCNSITLGPIPCNAKFTKSLDTSQKYKLFLINLSTHTSSTSYAWNFGDGGTSTQRNPSHHYATFGKYFVCLTVKDGACSSTYCDTVGMDSSGRLLKAGGFGMEVVEGTLGIKKSAKSDFKIYPNPATTIVTVDISSSGEGYNKIEIINNNGQVCIVQSIQKGIENIDIDLNSLAQGLYLIKLCNDKGYSYTKMMKY